MMAARGVPLVAVESGSARFSSNRLGGNAVWLTGASGTKYYYAHLSAYEGSSRSVSQGEVIGYVGATGATQADHLHFEMMPGGGGAVNPYPYVRTGLLSSTCTSSSDTPTGNAEVFAHPAACRLPRCRASGCERSEN